MRFPFLLFHSSFSLAPAQLTHGETVPGHDHVDRPEAALREARRDRVGLVGARLMELILPIPSSLVPSIHCNPPFPRPPFPFPHLHNAPESCRRLVTPKRNDYKMAIPRGQDPLSAPGICVLRRRGKLTARLPLLYGLVLLGSALQPALGSHLSCHTEPKTP